MCWAALIGTGVQAGQGVLQGQQNASTLSGNAAVLDLQANDALNRGASDEAVQANKTNELVAAQRAMQGASGVQVDSGSTKSVSMQALATGRLDEATIHTNAVREAWGYKIKADEARTQAVQAGFMQRLLLPGLENGSEGWKQAFQGGNPLNLGKQIKYIQTGNTYTTKQQPTSLNTIGKGGW